MRAEKCDVYWRSHGCGLPRFHEGDSLSHECGPCPPGCTAAPEEYMLLGHDEDQVFQGKSLAGKPIMADHCGMCSEHCGDRPTYDDRLYGEDVDFFPKRTGMPS